MTVPRYTVHNLDHSRKADRAGRTPLRCLAELASEFNVHPNKMIVHMRDDPAAPKPRLRTGTSRKAYYEPIEFRAWWRGRQQQNNGEAAGASA